MHAIEKVEYNTNSTCDVYLPSLEELSPVGLWGCQKDVGSLAFILRTRPGCTINQLPDRRISVGLCLGSRHSSRKWLPIIRIESESHTHTHKWLAAELAISIHHMHMSQTEVAINSNASIKAIALGHSSSLTFYIIRTHVVPRCLPKSLMQSPLASLASSTVMFVGLEKSKSTMVSPLEAV